ncbi:MAG: YlxM family DNA-binding protein [Firmicutes bacterium]|nr:YlxM family DNA-binding protein [Bacillota bacterium]MBQ2678126.1 YlxM family DNA-binding protein [Bacillota bacterium]MDO4859535.1 YlxM family DNA-binding protein [Bacillota bacterium]
MVKEKTTKKNMADTGRLDKTAEVSLLFDFYGEMLTPRQQEVVRLYHEENFSLTEIAEELEISRQAVHDTLKKAEKALGSYEDRLGLVARMEKSRKVIETTDRTIEKLMAGCSDAGLMKDLKKIRKAIDSLEE